MTAPAMPAGTTRRDALRWGLCFAVVAAAHAGAAMWLLYSSPSADADFVAGAPVVMIDLPAAPAAPPPSDLPPGPVEEPSEATPSPKEETKPPKQMDEVALPEPEPPKPEPPAEEKQATAPPSVATEAVPTAGVDMTPRPPSAAVLHWQSRLSAQIARLQHYPAKARARREVGRVVVKVTIDRQGKVLESHVFESSGSSDLDQELMSMVARAQPLPKPPPDAKDADLVIWVATRFSLK